MRNSAAVPPQPNFIAIMLYNHYNDASFSCSPALTGEVAPVQSSVPPQRLPRSLLLPWTQTKASCGRSWLSWRLTLGARPLGRINTSWRSDDAVISCLPCLYGGRHTIHKTCAFLVWYSDYLWWGHTDLHVHVWFKHARTGRLWVSGYQSVFQSGGCWFNPRPSQCLLEQDT